MNIVAYTSSLNQKAALRRCIRALLDQTYPVREIIVVDNRSSDGTPLEAFPEKVTLVCHLRNLGTSGAAATAFEYAFAAQYDWMWVLDQDSVPRKDALEKLVTLYESFTPEFQKQIGVLSSLVVVDPREELVYGHLLTRRGAKLIRLDQGAPYCESDTTIWSGSLYRVEAAKTAGLPRFGTKGYWEDFGLDMGDIEFGYRIKRAGFRVVVHPSSIIDHYVGDITEVNLGDRRLFTSNHPPSRRYLSFRNMVYFWLYIHADRHLLPVIFFLIWKLCKTMITIVVMEDSRNAKLWACMEGACDGLFKKLHRRY
jgi:rhamnosyltransferase